ncbi:MAG TPA: hypothetical protein VME70_07645, partial [Mycobacteriales bacterium]|nr:hypothetical protein [Mycobacteriales bacterium]
MTAASTRRSLHELARRCGVQLAYTAGDGRRVSAPTDSLVAILTALGHPVDDARSIEAQLERV